MDHCLYYQAHVDRKYCWFLVGTLKSFEHMAFDRTIDKEKSIFEFYVPESMKPYFETLMAYYIQEGVVSDLKELPNRLLLPDEQL